MISLDDPQQFLLYRMEREEIGARDYARLTFKECKRIARSVCRAYGVPQARLTRRVMGRWAAEWDNGVITLNPKKGTATDLLTILHELAHHVHAYLGEDTTAQEAHGPEFMACYLSILDTVRMIPYDAMATICRRRKLRFYMPGPNIKTLKAALDRRAGKASVRPAGAAKVRGSRRR